MIKINTKTKWWFILWWGIFILDGGTDKGKKMEIYLLQNVSVFVYASIWSDLTLMQSAICKI